jgi:hypothetical protein
MGDWDNARMEIKERSMMKSSKGEKLGRLLKDELT